MASTELEEPPFGGEGEPEPDLAAGWEEDGPTGRSTIDGLVEESVAPELDAIVSKLTPSNRELLDELFRVKFVGVRKVNPDDLS